MNEGAATIAAAAAFVGMLWMLVSTNGPLREWANENQGKALLLFFGVQVVAYFIGGQFAP